MLHTPKGRLSYYKSINHSQIFFLIFNFHKNRNRIGTGQIDVGHFLRDTLSEKTQFNYLPQKLTDTHSMQTVSKYGIENF